MTSILEQTRRPDVTFYPSGRIDIVARIAKLLDIHHGDVIDIAVNGCEYQLYVKFRGGCGNHEATVRSSKNNGRNLRCYSKRLCDAMMRTQNSDFNDVLRLPAGECIANEHYGRMVTLITKMNIIRSKQ